MKEKNKEIYDVFNYRYACKKFNKDKKVSDEDFATIIESARLSPSSFGLEPWKFLLLKNEKMKEDFKEFADVIGKDKKYDQVCEDFDFWII